MNRRAVRYAPAAERDLEKPADWLSKVASEKRAIDYVLRIRSQIEKLDLGGERGTVRDAHTGMRVISVFRPISVAFWIEDDVVAIQRVIYGGQDWKSDLATDHD